MNKNVIMLRVGNHSLYIFHKKYTRNRCLFSEGSCFYRDRQVTLLHLNCFCFFNSLAMFLANAFSQNLNQNVQLVWKLSVIGPRCIYIHTHIFIYTTYIKFTLLNYTTFKCYFTCMNTQVYK